MTNMSRALNPLIFLGKLIRFVLKKCIEEIAKTGYHEYKYTLYENHQNPSKIFHHLKSPFGWSFPSLKHMLTTRNVFLKNPTEEIFEIEKKEQVHNLPVSAQ